MNINVTKRDGRKELFDFAKIHRVLDWATQGIAHTSVSDIEMMATANFIDGISTRDVHMSLVDAADALITPHSLNYEYVANKLLNFVLRKEVFGSFEIPHLSEVIKTNIGVGLYNANVFNTYTPDDIEKLNAKLKHDRDFSEVPYGGIKSFMSKYLLQDRVSKRIYETPQIAYMRAAMALLHSRYSGSTRLKHVIECYDALSKRELNGSTPILANAGTYTLNNASCVLVDIDDTKESILASHYVVGDYVTQGAGIGVHIRYRSRGSKVSGGKIEHSGPTPFLKILEAEVKGWKQGTRGGSATVYAPIWIKDIVEFINLNAIGGTIENRIYKLDYGVGLFGIFEERLRNGQDISLFCPHESGLMKYWGVLDENGNHLFDAKYVEAENNPNISRTTISAKELAYLLADARLRTGRIYLFNVDNVNTQGMYKLPVLQSNLCTEITLPVIPLQSIDDPNGLIATCILAAINAGVVKIDSIPRVMRIAVMVLDALIDSQEYPSIAAERFTKKFRALGIGVTGWADYFAKNKIKFYDSKALALTEEYCREMMIAAIRASIDLAKEFGACEYLHLTKWADGVLPVDLRKKTVDTLIPHYEDPRYEELRKDLIAYGIRNGSLLSQMPCESSSDLNGATNGKDAIKSLIVSKKDKQGFRKIVAKYARTHADDYTFVWEASFSNEAEIRNTAVMQKYFDQAISFNTYTDTARYENGVPSVDDTLRLILMARHYGLKTMYYNLTEDGAKEFSFKDFITIGADANDGCAGGACKL